MLKIKKITLLYLKLKFLFHDDYYLFSNIGEIEEEFSYAVLF